VQVTNTSELSPVHAGVRFLVELAALAAWGITGWHLADGPARWILAIALPVLGAVVWATFRVPGDASADGGAPVAVPGIVRLVIEIDLLFGGAVAVGLAWRAEAGLALGAAVLAHYVTTAHRVRWLLAASAPPRR
jgi:hypothetical protein